MTKEEALIKELVDVAQTLRDYVDAIPKDFVLPAMPGMCRDWVDSVIDLGWKVVFHKQAYYEQGQNYFVFSVEK